MFTLDGGTGARTRSSARYRSRSQIQRLIDRAGVLDPRGRVVHTGMEELESRVLLAGFDPNGLGIGMDTLAAPRVLVPADVSTLDINGTGAGQHDTVALGSGGSLALSGILKLRFGALTLNPGDVFTLFSRTAGAGTISGAFLAIDGLAGVGGAGRNLVALQSPLRLVLVATDLPSADATIVTNTDTDLTALISYFSSGSGAPSFAGGVYAFGQHFNGQLALGGDTSALTIGLTDASPTDQARITVAGANGGNLYSVFGAAGFTLRPRTDATAPGLRLDSGFTISGYALGDSIISIPAMGASNRLGPFSFTNVNPTYTSLVVVNNSVAVVAGLSADSLSLAFPGSGTTNPGGSTVTATTVTADFGIGLELSGAAIVHTSGGNRFTITAATLDAEIPGVIKAHATTVVLGYDPDGGREQELISIDSMTVEMPTLGLTGTVTGSAANHGLIIRGDGFQFGTFAIGPTNTTDFLPVGSSPLSIKNWQFTITDFGMTFPVAGAPIVSTPLGIAFSVEAFKVEGLGSGVTASGENILAEVIIGPNGPTGYTLSAMTLDLDVPNVAKAHATGVVLGYTPGAGREQTFFTIDTMTVEFPKLGLVGAVTGSTSGAHPHGLVIRGDGFQFGTFTLGPINTTDFFQVASSPLWVRAWQFAVSDFGMTFDTGGVPTLTTPYTLAFSVGGFEVRGLASGTTANGENITATLVLGPGSVPTGYSLTADSLFLDVPGVLTASATGVGLMYTQGQDRSDPLFFTETMTIDVPRLNLRGSVAPSAGNPGLTIRGDGFHFGNLTVTLDTSTAAAATDPVDAGDGHLGLSDFLRINNPSITLTDFGLTVPDVGPAVWTLGGITLAAEGIKIGKPVGSFRAVGTSVSATVALDGDDPQFTFCAGSVTITLPHVSVFGTEICFDPQGTDGYLLRVDGTVGGTLALPGAAPITGEIGGFQINTLGDFEALSGFNLGITIGSIGSLGNVLGGVRFPSFLIPSFGGFTAALDITWPDFNLHPGRLMMDISTTFNVPLGPLSASIAVEHLVIDTAKLFESTPKNPFVSWTSFSGTVSGNIAGAAISAGLVVGIVRFDLSGAPYPTSSVVTDPDLISDSILYFGVSASIMLMNRGVELYFGISERGFLQAYVRADVDIPLGNTSLVLTGFRGGVTFNATQLPEISDPVDLRAPIFQPPGRLTFDQWRDSLRQLVINQNAGHGAVFFEVDGTGQTWSATLDLETDPGLYLPAGIRTAFLNAGIAVTRTPGAATLIKLTTGSLWLLRDTSGEYLIAKDGNTFAISGINFSLAGEFIAAFPATPGASTTADMISYADADGTHTLVQAFGAMRIPLSASATVTKAASGDEWEINDNGIKYRVSVKGGDAPVLSVMGGESPIGSGNAGVFRIDAGFTLTSVGGDQAWRIDADAIVTIGATITDTRIVLLGALEVGPESAPTLRVDAKLYLTLAHALDTPTARVDMFLLVDFTRPPSAAEMTAMGGPTIPYLSIYGHVILSLPTGPGGSLGIRLEGSSTEGLAVFNTAGLTGGAFADQRFRLGGLGSQQAFLELTLSSNKLEFSYYVNLSADGIITAASLGQSAGHFVIEFNDVDLTGDGVGDVLLPVNFYGAAKLSVTTADISAFQTAGISGDLVATLKINISSSAKSVTLNRTFDNAIGPTEVVPLKASSLAIFAATQLTFEPRIGGTVIASKVITGVFSLEVTPTDLNLLILGTAPLEIPVGPLAVPVQADVLGMLVLKRNDHGTPLDPFDDTFSFGARLEIGIESRTGEFIHFGLDLRMFMNSTSTDLTISLPEDFMSRFAPTPSQSSLFSRLTFNPTTNTLEAVIPRGAPTLTFNPLTYDPASPGTQIDPAGPYIAIIGIGEFTLGNEADFGFAIAMNGNVRIKFGYDNTASAATFSLSINAQANIGPLGTLIASGQMDIIAGPGVFHTWGSFQLVGSVNVGQLSLVAALSIDVNTSNTTKTVAHYYNPATLAPSTTPIMENMPPGMRIFAAGNLSWSGTSLVAGRFTFATTPGGMSMTFDAMLNLQPIGGVAVTGALDLYNSGDAVGFVTVAAGFSAVGFRFDGQAYMKINTLDTPQPLALPTGTQNIAANSFEIYVNGDLRLTTFGDTNLLSLHGEFWLINNPTFLQVQVAASLGLGDFFGTGPAISMAVNGFAKVYKVGQQVLVLDVGVSVTNASLRLNTSTTPGDVRDGVPRGFHIGGTLGLKVVGLTLATVTASIDYEPDAPFAAANGAWHISANLDVNFFGIISLTGQVDIYSRGAFYFSLAGGVNFGDEWFGAGFNASMTFNFRAQNDGNGNSLDPSDLIIFGAFSGEAHAGIVVWGEFIGISLSAGGTFNYNGATREMTVYVFADFGFPIGEVGGTFSIGTLDFQAPPPPQRVAGPAAGGQWADSTGGVLHLNVGTRAHERNFSTGETLERYTVEAITPLVGGRQTLRVTGLGITQTFENVSSIIASFDSNADYFFAGRDGVRLAGGAVPLALSISVTGGAGNDTIIVYTTGTVTINGNAGNDYIEALGAGGSINGDDNDDTITWLAGAETAATLNGGLGVNALQVVLTSGVDRVLVDRSASNFLVKRLTAGGSAFDTLTSSNFMILTLTTRQGADTLHVGDLTAVGVKKVILDPSQYDTGTTTSTTVGGVTTTRRVFASDTDPDAITIDGQSAAANTMNLVTGTDPDDLDGDGNTAESMLAVLVPDDTDSALIRFKIYNTSRAAGDTVAVNGGADADLINASAVAVDLAALTLSGLGAADTITGSPFVDFIHGGEGANALHGGSGNDSITAGSGDDTITGGAGNDTVNAGNGTNNVEGGTGEDHITTGSGPDTIRGGSENDTILAGNGANIVFGDGGNDQITTGTGNDAIDGGDGNDTIDSGLGDDTVTGGLGTDVYTDVGGNDTLIEARPGAFRDYTITDDTFIVGTALPSGPIDFADRYAVADEVENLAGIFEVAFITGGSGANRFAVGDVDGSVLINGVPRAVAQHWSGTLTLDGLGGSDLYFITVFGDRGAIVNVLDTGGVGNGIDRLIVFGADDETDADTFLIRPSFIASVKDIDADLVSDTVDRINFNAALERSTPTADDAIVVHGLSGDDRFISDDTSYPMTLLGGEGSDYFQFGQLFGSLRNPPFVAAGDAFTTTAVDLTPAGSSTHITGHLSSGASFTATASGGNGEDTFFVNRTMAVLALQGDAGNDVFTVRAFALDGTTTVNQSTTNVSGGAGDDSIEYAANAPIDIDGGEGVDSIRMLGTQFNDQFRITASGITLLTASGGTPIVISFVGVESLELHAGDGNDSVYIVSTAATIRTLLFGGGGSDRFYFGLDPLNPAASRTLTSIAGPVLVEGAPGDPTIFGLSTPVMLPTESNTPLPPGAGSMSDHELPGDVDIVDIDATEETRNLSGAMGPRVWPLGTTTTINLITLSGLDMGGDLLQDSQTVPGGISFHNLEVIDVRLGSGNETLAVSGVLSKAITLLAGNGGGDTFNVSAPHAVGAMLVLYGDSRPGEALLGAPGIDRIDARSSSLAATIDAGPGADVVLAGFGDDRIAGGSGDDVISGGAGDDLIFGDSRLIVDRLTRVSTIVTFGLADSDLGGRDTINPGAGFNIVFGDHGLIAQDFHAAGAFRQFGLFTSALTVHPTIGDADVISSYPSAHAQFATLPASPLGHDLIFGGAAGDTIDSGDGNDWVIGDHASAAIFPPIDPATTDLNPAPAPSIPTQPQLVGPTMPVHTFGGLLLELSGGVPRITINSTDALDGAADLIDSGSGDDVILGGVGADTIDAGSGNDVIFGDHGRFDPDAPVAGRFVSTFSTIAAAGGNDHILAGPGNDIAMGQQGADSIFGHDGDDDLIGGHNVPLGLDAADILDGSKGNDAILGDNGTIVRTPGALSPRMVTPSGAVVPGQTTASLYDANFDPAVTPGAPNIPGSALVRTVFILDASPSSSPTLFGNDLIAGGAGDDLILAGNGNDTLRGDGFITDSPAPTLSASIDPASDGDDYIEGNSGDDTIHGDLGQDDLVGGGSSLFGLTPADRADGADTIFGGDGSMALHGSLGDTSSTGAARDADVIAGDNADILRLVAANGSPLWYNYDAGAVQRTIPRVVRLLDYTADGLSTGDVGAADVIRGESGNDLIYGMTGNDTLYGDGQDDDLIGGSGDDWIYGGTGNDGVLGDDGRILTARGGVAEPLFGLAASTQQIATTPDALFTQTVLATGVITKHARLQASTAGGADVVYGGLGNDSLHGGGGMDAISGAEALAGFTAPPAVRPTLAFNIGLRRFTVFNPGFAANRILNFFLNFDAGLPGQHIDDGADIIFGGDDHDWLVGGTNTDFLFSGMGDDVLNADDNLDTVNGLNTVADVGPYASPDIAFGGAGLDRLIGNAAHDRLIDWNGEFNQYILPFAPAYPTVTKNYTTSILLALQTLGYGSGADSRLAEPGGELGIVLSTDVGWLDQYGRQLI